jgi:chaperone required for assembly of F1-ATPase
MTEPAARPRRFYKTVSVEPADQGFAVRLDGRAAKTPRGEPLVAPSQAVAELIASEWEGQGESVDFSRMPATRLAFTAIDRTPRHRVGMAGEVAAFAESDLLCYLAEDPPSLAEREAAAWGPWLAWAERELAIALRPSIGIAPAVQPEESLARARAEAAALDDFSLTGLAFAAGLFGSAVLAFAVARGALDAVEAFELSRLDEAFQQERWGIDAEAAARTESMRAEAAMLQRWFGT